MTHQTQGRRRRWRAEQAAALSPSPWPLLSRVVSKRCIVLAAMACAARKVGGAPTLTMASVLSAALATALAAHGGGGGGGGVGVRLTETSRLAEYQRRNHTYPPRQWNPDVAGWSELQAGRIEQVRRLRDSGQRYEGWLQTMTSGFVSPNFTDYGWGLTRAPPDILEELKRKLHDGLPNARNEAPISAIGGDLPPYFVPAGMLALKTLEVLRPMHEEWSGVPLKGATAYGLRAYRNNSNLLMHVDKPLTHIISSILHIDHSDDSEPWPMYVEDLHGNTNEVVLDSGDMLFYESSKCMHGRPRNFTGSWYSSLFIHYHPAGWDTKTRKLEGDYAIPPDWVDPSPPSDDIVRLEMVGTAFKEPDCPNLWCNTQNTVKWSGPAPDGVVVTVGYDPDDPSTWRTAGAYRPSEEEDMGDGGEEL